MEFPSEVKSWGLGGTAFRMGSNRRRLCLEKEEDEEKRPRREATRDDEGRRGTDAPGQPTLVSGKRLTGRRVAAELTKPPGVLRERDTRCDTGRAKHLGSVGGR